MLNVFQFRRKIKCGKCAPKSNFRCQFSATFHSFPIELLDDEAKENFIRHFNQIPRIMTILCSPGQHSQSITLRKIFARKFCAAFFFFHFFFRSILSRRLLYGQIQSPIPRHASYFYTKQWCKHVQARRITLFRATHKCVETCCILFRCFLLLFSRIFISNHRLCITSSIGFSYTMALERYHCYKTIKTCLLSCKSSRTLW